MTIQTERTPCITVSCDDCGDDVWEDGTPHFESVEQARKYCDGWLFTDDEQACHRFHPRRVCAAEGHTWSDWRPSPRDALQVWRSCERCGDFDYTSQ